MSDEVLPSMYKVVSNRIRRRMIQLLSQEKMTYLELLISSGLDPDRHHGWFDYHLKVLLEARIIKKEGDQYLLTNYGEGISNLLSKIEGESQKLFRKEVALLEKEKNVKKFLEINIDGKARLLKERDVPSIAEALFKEEFYRSYSKLVKDRLIQTAKRGLGKYTNTLVVEREGKAVCRAIIDTQYPPYAEIGVDPVHPKYVGQEEDIWSDLIKGSISLAKQLHCNIIYTIEFGNSPSVQREYKKYGIKAYRACSKFGFQPTMIRGFEDEDKEICLFRFLDISCYQDFIQKNPLSILSISGDRIDFHQNKVYETRWNNLQTNNYLTFYLKGKRHESMPRIVGISRKEGMQSFDAWTEEITPEITQKKLGKFRVHLENTGKQKMKTQMNFLLPEGILVDGEPKKTTCSELDIEASYEMKLEAKPDFKVPALSFWTVPVTCQLQIGSFKSVFPITAGFELDRPPMKKK